MISFEVMSKSRTTDFTLLEDVKLGLPEAVSIWYKKYSPYITRFVSRRVNASHDVDEIVRETFLNCLRHLPLFQGKSSIKTWMTKIASHEIADYYRRRYAKKFIHALPLSKVIVSEDPKDMHETSEYVKEVLTHMRQDYRELLLLKYVDRISVKDIAEKLHRSVKSIESDLFRARQEFRSLYITLNS